MHNRRTFKIKAWAKRLASTSHDRKCNRALTMRTLFCNNTANVGKEVYLLAGTTSVFLQVQQCWLLSRNRELSFDNTEHSKDFFSTLQIE